MGVQTLKIKRWLTIIVIMIFVTLNQSGGIATLINILDPKASTEIIWNDGDPVILLHNSIAASGKYVTGRTFGHVIALDCDPYCGYTLKHELAHVKQANILRSYYVPMSLGFMIISYLISGSYYELNPLEWGPYHDDPVPFGFKEN